MKFCFQRGAWAAKKAYAVLAALKPEQIKKVAVIRHAALGDMVLTRPFLIELRRFFPQASITFSAVSHYQNGIPHDLIDELHVIDGSDRRNVSKWQQLKKLRSLGEQDIIFDAASTPRSRLLCAFSSAKIKIGFPYKVLQRWFYSATVLRTAFRFETEMMLDMLHLLGHTTEYPPRFDMPGEVAHRSRPCIVYFTGSSKPEKCWPNQHFAQLVDEMSMAYPDIEHIFIEGRAKWESIDPILDAIGSRENVYGLKGTGLDDMISLIKAASLVISNDTGIRHLAIASDVPTLGLFFDDYPFRYWPRFGLHEIGFNSDASIPAVQQVSKTMHSMLYRIFNK